jgi:hypothetical protein
MFLRRCYRRRSGKRHAYWALVESYRTARGPRQRVVAWKTLGQMCKRAGLGDEPRRVLDELSGIRLVDVVLRTRDGREIRRRYVTRPDDHQAILLHRLGLTLPEYLPVTDEEMTGV